MSESLAQTESPLPTSPSQSLECDTADYPNDSSRNLLRELPSRVGKPQVKPVEASAILTKATGFMGTYDFTLNPYSGCGFGCTYCYAAFFARDADLRDSWGEWVSFKENAVTLLSRPRQQAKLDGARIYMSSVTDAYQPVERRLNLTRQLLEIMAFGAPVESDVNVQASMFAEPRG